MPPRKRASSKPSFSARDLTNKRKMAQIADIFQFDANSFQKAARDTAPAVHEADLKKSMEAESVLLFVAVHGKGFKRKFCKQCGMEFLHTYTIVAFCSDDCRSKSLRDLGIPWNPNAKSDIERWDNRMPMIIGPYGTFAVDNWLVYNPEQLEFEFEYPEPPKPPELSAEEELDRLLAED